MLYTLNVIWNAQCNNCVTIMCITHWHFLSNQTKSIFQFDINIEYPSKMIKSFLYNVKMMKKWPGFVLFSPTLKITLVYHIIT